MVFSVGGTPSDVCGTVGRPHLCFDRREIHTFGNEAVPVVDAYVPALVQPYPQRLKRIVGHYGAVIAEFLGTSDNVIEDVVLDPVISVRHHAVNVDDGRFGRVDQRRALGGVGGHHLYNAGRNFAAPEKSQLVKVGIVALFQINVVFVVGIFLGYQIRRYDIRGRRYAVVFCVIDTYQHSRRGDQRRHKHYRYYFYSFHLSLLHRRPFTSADA